jgi:hypothetical protein
MGTENFQPKQSEACLTDEKKKNLKSNIYHFIKQKLITKTREKTLVQTKENVSINFF